jgi:hypothetical protein
MQGDMRQAGYVPINAESANMASDVNAIENDMPISAEFVVALDLDFP